MNYTNVGNSIHIMINMYTNLYTGERIKIITNELKELNEALHILHKLIIP